MPIHLTRDDATGVWTLRMDSGENRIHPDSLKELSDALDKVEASEGAAALVTTGTGKFFSNGLDLAQLGGKGPDGALAMLHQFQSLLARIMTFPIPTVAACNGHTYAGGCMLALAHDVRIMRSDRGYLCLPEIALRAPFSRGMADLLQAKVGRADTKVQAMVFGKRYTGPEAVKAGLVDQVQPEADVLPTAQSLAAHLARIEGRDTMSAIKQRMFRGAAESLCSRQMLAEDIGIAKPKL